MKTVPTVLTFKRFLALAAFVLTLTLTGTALANTVKITPLGGVKGEFCRFDRALILEDPNGTRLLYDAGRTVAGATDPRLGKIDGILVSHVHGDHLGDRHQPAPNAGTCGKPDISVVAAPNSNSVNIMLAKKAKLVIGGELNSFLSNKVESLGGNPKDVVLVRFGASATVGGVKITTVPAVHSNGLHPAFIPGELGTQMKSVGLTAYVGPPGGYVVTFTNGLVLYLSGDTGITAEQDTVVRGHYKAKLVVMNIGDTFTTGPAEAAYVINELVKPAAVIASHANEVATENGKVIAGTRTELFRKATKVPVHIPLSEHTMEFNSNGKCTMGC